jgi:hypothetical protein
MTDIRASVNLEGETGKQIHIFGFACHNAKKFHIVDYHTRRRSYC